MTLNPLKHFDFLGIFLFAVAGFGWAKPVPINPNNFDNYKKGCFWTSIAGILTNYIMAFVVYPLFVLVFLYVCPIFEGRYMATFLYAFFNALFIFSLSFCVFNLLPFHPLDGFRVIEATARRKNKAFWFLYQYGQYVLLGLVGISFLARRMAIFAYIDVLGYVLLVARKIFGQPIVLFWNWILSLFGVNSPFIM
jgi:Zn-dependent protease